VAVGLLGVGVFYLVVSLVALGEIRLRRGELGETRVWLIREANQRGLGISSTRTVSGREADGRACVETRVRFIVAGPADPPPPVRYCECWRKTNGAGAEGHWESTGECPAETSGPIDRLRIAKDQCTIGLASQL
jgi:hypothetical protein